MDHQAAGALKPELAEEFSRAYLNNASIFKKLLKIVKTILEDEIESKMFPAFPVTTRVKELSSALSSLQRRQSVRVERQNLIQRLCDSGGNWEQYCQSRGKGGMVNDWGPFDDLPSMIDALHDFGGARICVNSLDDVRKFVTLLYQCKHLKVLKVTHKGYGNSEIDDLKNDVEQMEQSLSSDQSTTRCKTEATSEERRPTEYRATHVVIGLRGNTIFKSHEDFHYKVEIQVRTILMDVWAQVEHLLVYKPRGHEASDKVKEALKTWNKQVRAIEDEEDTFLYRVKYML